MEAYNLLHLDFFSLPDLKRGELSNIHSILLFLYSRYTGSSEIPIKYSEIVSMSSETAYKTLCSLIRIGLIDLVQKPTKTTPLVVKLKTNEELQVILSKHKKIEFKKYQNRDLTKEDLKETSRNRFCYWWRIERI